MRTRFRNNALLFSIVVFLAFGIRLYRLDEIPGEWFGDISNVHEYVQQIQQRKWPFYFFQSTGPLYHYVIAPFIALDYNGYMSYKLASVFVSLAGLGAIALFTYEASSLPVAFVAALVSSVSFWFLVWSRLGNSQIVIPLLTGLTAYFMMRYFNGRKTRHLIMGLFIASLGWYTYPQTFILPLWFVILFFGFCVAKRNLWRNKWIFLLLLTEAVALTYPFSRIVTRQWNDFVTGYIGTKSVAAVSLGTQEMAQRFLRNLYRTSLMFHIRGDGTFRVNVEGKPHLDRISGMFFLIGIAALIAEKRWNVLFVVLTSMIILVLPSVSPALPESEIPSSSRTIGVIPFTYFLVALGMHESYTLLVSFSKKHRKKKVLHAIITGVFSLLILFQAHENIRRYFIVYAYGLPEHNAATGRQIASYIDKNIPPSVAVYFGSCCWGEWGEPEPKAVYYNLLEKREVEDPNKTLAGCTEVTRLPALVILAPTRADTIRTYQACFPGSRLTDIPARDGTILFRELFVENSDTKPVSKD